MTRNKTRSKKELEKIKGLIHLFTTSPNLIHTLKDMVENATNLSLREQYLVSLLRSCDFALLSNIRFRVWYERISNRLMCTPKKSLSPHAWNKLLELETVLNLAIFPVVLKEDELRDITSDLLTLEENKVSGHPLYSIVNKKTANAITHDLTFESARASHRFYERWCVSSLLTSYASPLRLHASFTLDYVTNTCLIRCIGTHPESLSFCTYIPDTISYARQLNHLRAQSISRMIFDHTNLDRIILDMRFIGEKEPILHVEVTRDEFLKNSKQLLSITEKLNPESMLLPLPYNKEIEAAFKALDLPIIPARIQELDEATLVNYHAKTPEDTWFLSTDTLMYAWLLLDKQTYSSTKELVEELEKLKARLPQIPAVQTASKRLEIALIEGSVDYSNKNAQHDLFISTDPILETLDQTLSFLKGIERDDDTNQDSETYFGLLEKIEKYLIDCQELGLYEDNKDTEYRWFGNAVARYTYNRLYAKDKRVSIIPNHYFWALQMHAGLCLLSSDLSRMDKTVQVANKIAPTSCDTYIMTAKYYREKSEYYHAIDYLKKALEEIDDYGSACFVMQLLSNIYLDIGNYPVAGALLVVAYQYGTEMTCQQVLDRISDFDEDEKDLMGLDDDLDFAEVLKKEGIVINFLKQGDRDLTLKAVLFLEHNILDLGIMFLAKCKYFSDEEVHLVFETYLASILGEKAYTIPVG